MDYKHTMQPHTTKFYCAVIAILMLPNYSFSSDSTNLQIGGSLRFSYRYKDWNENNKSIGGDAVVDVFKLNVKASFNKLWLDADYRFYSSQFGGAMIHHGFIGYRIDQYSHIELGIHQVPFGILPYASDSWFLNLPYYVGLEDDYDTGIKYRYNSNSWDFAIAYYIGAEGTRSSTTYSDNTKGTGLDPSRYSYDLTGDFEENGQFNIRLAKKFLNQEIGISGQMARYRNHVEGENHYSHAYAIHYHGKLLKKKQLDIKFEALAYQYNGTPNDLIELSAYNSKYNIASKAHIFCGGIAYTLPVKISPIESIKFYNNYNYMKKANSAFHDTQMNVLGMLIKAGPIYTYVDYAMGKNQDWIGPWGAFGENANQYGFGRGEKETKWRSWFNINIGYYF